MAKKHKRSKSNHSTPTADPPVVETVPRMKRKEFDAEMRRLHGELVKLAEHAGRTLGHGPTLPDRPVSRDRSA